MAQNYTTKILVPVLDKPGDRGAFIKWTTESLKYPPRFRDFPAQDVTVRAVFTEPGRIMLTVHDDQHTVYVALQLLALTPLSDGGWLGALRIAPAIPEDEDANIPIILRFLTHEKAVLLESRDVEKWKAEINLTLEAADKVSESDMAQFTKTWIEFYGGELPKNSYYVQHGPENKPHFPICVSCEKQLQDSDELCPHFGINRCAPACTKCGERLTKNKSELRRFLTCVWNEDWKEVCEHCKFVYKAKLYMDYRDQITVALGDEDVVQDPNNPKYLILTVEGETVRTPNNQCDFWKVTPLIKFKRAYADGHAGEHTEEGSESSLSVQELKIVFDLLMNGPLKPLMDRDAWTYDTT